MSISYATLPNSATDTQRASCFMVYVERYIPKVEVCTNINSQSPELNHRLVRNDLFNPTPSEPLPFA
jgi:hypothetical protein